MTKEQLKKANKIIQDIEYNKERKKVLLKNSVATFSIENRYQSLVKFSYKDVPDRTKELIDEIIDGLVERTNKNIEALEKALEDL